MSFCMVQDEGGNFCWILSWPPLQGLARGVTLGAHDPPPFCEIIVLCPYNSGGQNTRIQRINTQ